LLGLSAAFSHTIIVWVLALAALTYGNELIAEDMEPWFFAVSGALIIAISVWIFFQILRSKAAASEHHHHHHDHDHGHGDKHAQAHASEIETRFASGKATTGQVVMFGLTGGLLPCAAAVTVLIICLHLQKFWLGVALVGAFSAGLAITLVVVGVVAAVGISALRKKSSQVDGLLAKAPYASSVLIAAIGVVMLISGLSQLT
jgi:nickel/cobalt exporter